MSPIAPPDPDRVAAIVQAALDEDGAQHDLTSSFLDLGDRAAAAEITVAARVVCCGIEVARVVFRRVDPACSFEELARDGEVANDGAVVCRLEGRAASIVSAAMLQLCGPSAKLACFTAKSAKSASLSALVLPIVRPGSSR